MERALRLEVASQKSLHGVYDGLAEKSMRRFSMVACYHFKRIAPGARIWAWKEPEPQGYLVTYYDVGNHPVWMTLWSTELPSGNGERLWWETERFARDFNRDTVLVSEDEQGVVCYRFYSPDRGARAWVRVAPDGSSVTGEQTEQFFQGLVKRWRRGALELEAVHFEERTQACAWLDDAFGFQPREMPERRSVLKAAARNALKSPFHVMPLVRERLIWTMTQRRSMRRCCRRPRDCWCRRDFINRRAISTGCGRGGPIWSASSSRGTGCGRTRPRKQFLR